MKRFSEQLHKQSTSVKLQAVEKRELRERLVSYMEYHPLPAELKSKSATGLGKNENKIPLFTETFKTFQIPFVALFKSSAVAAVIMLVVLPFVAEKAVPGDVLYAMKVQFNEELRATLTFDSYQKVEWETERVNRRIAEARLLANEGRLTEEVEAEVAQAVKTHTENAQREIEVLRIEDADGATIAAIALDTTLEVQSNSLRGDKDSKSKIAGFSTSTQQSNLIANVLDQSLSLSEAKSASSTLPAYDKLMARAEQNTTRIYELLDSVKQSAPTDQVTDVTRRIQDIERTIKTAMELSTTDNNAARHQLVGVLQSTQKLIVYMTELEVTHTVDIESLVPVVLTKAEEDIVIKNLTEELNLKIARIQEQSVLVDDKEVSEKIDYSIGILLEQAATAASSTEDFKVFKGVANQALILANDVLIILEYYLTPVEQVISDGTKATTTTEGSKSEEVQPRASSTEGTGGNGVSEPKVG